MFSILSPGRKAIAIVICLLLVLYSCWIGLGAAQRFNTPATTIPPTRTPSYITPTPYPAHAQAPSVFRL